MKRIFTVLAAILLTATLWAQSPEKMSYQAVIRNSSDALVSNTQVGMQISILQGAEDGTVVYTETQTPTTNANGLVSIEIGGGAGFDAIDWANAIYFIKTETDLNGGADYTITGTSQLLSVPYALHSKTAENGLVDGTTPGEMQYWNGTEWVAVSAGNQGNILTFVNNAPMWRPEVEDGDVLNSSTGKVWMDRNLGASQVATSSTDAAAYGDLYQWGRGTDGHQIRTSGTTSTLATSDTPGHGDFILATSDPYNWRSPQNDNLWQGVSGINNPCPSGYRLPTEDEWDTERASWSSNDAAGAFASPLKLSMAGFRFDSDGSLGEVGFNGSYWSMTVNGTHSQSMYFSISEALMGNSLRAIGLSVRCIKD